MLSRVPRFHALKLKRVVQGKAVTMLLYGGDTHNSINPSCIEGDTLDVMEDKHEEDANLQVLVKNHDEKYFGQVYVGFEKKGEESLAMEKVV